MCGGWLYSILLISDQSVLSVLRPDRPGVHTRLPTSLSLLHYPPQTSTSPPSCSGIALLPHFHFISHFHFYFYCHFNYFHYPTLQPHSFSEESFTITVIDWNRDENSVAKKISVKFIYGCRASFWRVCTTVNRQLSKHALDSICRLELSVCGYSNKCTRSIQGGNGNYRWIHSQTRGNVILNLKLPTI